MTFSVSRTGFAGHRDNAPRKILKTTNSSSVVLALGRLIWSRYKVWTLARTWSAAEAPPRSIMVIIDPMIIPTNIFIIRIAPLEMMVTISID